MHQVQLSEEDARTLREKPIYADIKHFVMRNIWNL